MDECKPLERGDSIVEGHYSERTFAALLLPTLPAHVVGRCRSTLSKPSLKAPGTERLKLRYDELP